MNSEHLHSDGRPFTKDEFVEKIKTDKIFANKFGNLGPIYGSQWRAWNNYLGDEIAPNGFEMWNEPIDQISELINQLKNNPDSRRMVVSAWAVHDLPNMVLPPCHMFFQFYTRELSDEERWKIANLTPNMSEFDYCNKLCDENNVPKRAISLMWYQRSCDVPLGLPFNIASYALLLEIVARMVNMVPDELIGTLGDTHIYSNQVDGVKEQLTKEPYELPTLKMGKTDAFYKSLSEDLSLLGHLDPSDFAIENYQSHSTIKIPLSN